MELEDRFRVDKEHLDHANVLATKYQDAMKAAIKAKKLADAKRAEAEESLNAVLDSFTKAEDRIQALESEFKQAKRAVYESGSKDAQEEMRLQLPRVCNEFYTDAWHDAVALLNSGQTTMTPEPPKLPFPGAPPPLPPHAVLNSPPPQLGAVMVDLEDEEVNSAETAVPVDADHLPDAPVTALEGGSTVVGDAGLNDL